MTPRPDIEATLSAAYNGYLVEGVCAALAFAILAAAIAIGAA